MNAYLYSTPEGICGGDLENLSSILLLVIMISLKSGAEEVSQRNSFFNIL